MKACIDAQLHINIGLKQFTNKRDKVLKRRDKEAFPFTHVNNEKHGPTLFLSHSLMKTDGPNE